MTAIAEEDTLKNERGLLVLSPTEFPKVTESRAETVRPWLSAPSRPSEKILYEKEILPALDSREESPAEVLSVLSVP